MDTGLKPEPHWVTADIAAKVVNRNPNTILVWMRLKEIARKVEGVRHGEKTYFCDLNEVIAYVAKKKNTMPNKQPNSPSDDSTMEEVEQCIREQMQCLPDWWNEDTEKMANATVTTLIRGKF